MTTTIDSLTPAQKRALLAAKLKEKRRREGPASFPQQRMWFLHRLNPEDTSYNLPRAVRVEGALDIELWGAAVERIVARHAALRTTFREVDGEPLQVVRDRLAPEMSLVDMPELDGPDGDARLIALAQEEFARPFDLESGPLLRLKFLRVRDDLHFLLVSIHHITADLWSTSLFLTELAELYAALVEGREAVLPEIPVQYVDYARWQHRRLAAGEYEGDLRHWRSELEGAPSALELAADRPRPPMQTANGASLPFTLPREVMDQVRAVSQRHGATPFMTMLAAFAVLLQRYSRSDDFVVGVPTASRERAEIERVMGYFVNMLPIRVRMDEDPTFADLVGRVRTAVLGAFSHQEIPFEKVVEEIQPPRDPSRTPVFQVSFIYQNIPLPGFDAAGVRLVPLDVASTTARFDLELQVFDDEDLTGWFEFNTDIFDEQTVAAMADQLGVLVRALVAAPEEPVSAARIAASVRGAATLAGEARTGEPVDLCVATRAARDAMSVSISAEADLTYAALEERVAALAGALAARGVRPGAPVGICLPRGADMVAALLAVWRAGGAALPLDPSFPRDRIAYMVEDSGVEVIVGAGATLDVLDRASVPLMRVDEPLAEPAPVPAPAERGPEDLAYVIYTSGSTGRPKGVEVQHGALTNFLLSMAERPGLREDDVLVAVTTLSFDISLLELLLPLTVGARVVVAPRETAVDGPALRALLDESDATVMQATPATWRMLLDAGWRGRDGFTCLVGGEALPPGLAAELLGLHLTVWNMYGPTETTIWSAVTPVTDTDIHLGDPVAGTDLLVVDDHGQPQPTGVPGELWIGGAGLARGYLRRPELTAERFVPHPVDPEARAYRTGDLVRRRHDGRLQFLGRLDHQVKLRGFRIELGEIESELLRHPAVQEAVAVVRGDGPAGQQLVAYLVQRAGEDDLTRAEVATHLRERLPDYMVPAAVVRLDAVPRTPNGKTDRAALPAPDLFGAAEHVPPQTPVEAVVASVWEEVLGVERVGSTDDFFALGGHSLLSTRILVRLREVFEVEVPLQSVFRDPTVAGLARAVLEAAPDRAVVMRTAEILVEMSNLDDEEIEAELAGPGQGDQP